MIALTLAQLAHVLDGQLHLAPGDDAATDRLRRRRHRLPAHPAGRHLRRQARRGHRRPPVRRRRGRGRRGRGDRGARGRRIRHPGRRGRRDRRPRRPRAVRRGGTVRDAGDLRIVGITGSNGKTTTKNMLARILEDEGETVAPRGLVQQRGRRAAHDAAGHRGHTVPGERVRRERARRDRAARGTRRARHGRRAHGRHGPRRWIRRDRGDVRGQVGAGPGAPSRRVDRPERRRSARGRHGSDRRRARRGGALVRPRRRRGCPRRRRRGPCRRHPLHGDGRRGLGIRCICACSASTTS